MRQPVPKPKNRSALRFRLGVSYFSIKRRLFWLFCGIKFASTFGGEPEYTYFAHQTPLLRELKDVDMHLQHNKITNLKIAASKINRITVNPGETFSFWRFVGKPTKRKGYLEGMLLQNGMVTAGTGGGLCQLSNLIYWMTVHTPLTVVERYRHGYDAFPDSGRTQPFGSGATCFYNYIDLMIRNDTAQPFQLTLEIAEHELKGAWRTYEPPDFRYDVYEKEHYIQSESWGGYTRHNLIHRLKYDMDNVLIAEDFVAENHAIMMYSPLLTS